MSNSYGLFAGEVRYDDENDVATSLVNPMEKYFDQDRAASVDSSDRNSNNQTPIMKSANFADRVIPLPLPLPPPSKPATRQNKTNDIKQTSTNNDDDQDNNNIPNNSDNTLDNSNFDPFAAQAPPNSLSNIQPTEQNYNSTLNNFGNFDSNSSNDGFYQNGELQQQQQYYQPQYSQQNYSADQLQQYYQQYGNQYSPQYYPQYSPQYSSQYYPYYNGTYSPFGHGQGYEPYNFNVPEYYGYGYGYSDANQDFSASGSGSEIGRGGELMGAESSRELERMSRREAAERARLEAEWSPKPPRPILYPLLTKVWSCVTTLSPFNAPTGPDRGVGMPLRNGSWLDRPYYFGGFIGKMRGSELVSNMIDQDNGANGGLIIGNNMNEYWGLEGRLHFAAIDIKETSNGRTQYALWHAAQSGGAIVYVPNLTTRSNRLTILDVSVHYYPLGNARFRPYFKYGLGYARESFHDTFGQKRTAETLSMPFGVGLRYWWNKQFAIHAEVVDNIIFSHDIVKTQGNWAFSIGLIYSFGNNNKRRPIVHWPYTPSSGSRR
ncbi:MAG: porin family protein [Planctomycetaceae bacterium]|nr:porin family protein [Planctomycetaceae bacterium]